VRAKLLEAYAEMSQPPPSAPSAVSSDVYAVFSDNINQGSVQRIFNAFAIGMANKIQHVHLLFQSWGGYVGDGVCLYNFFKTLPIDLTIYNAGAVQSIALIAYLGAKERKTSRRAVFMMHRTSSGNQPTTAARLKGVAKMLTLDDTRSESILREHITLSAEDWETMDNQDVYFSGEEATQNGIAHAIGEFSPPPGVQIYNI
jgi:ATP-dependent Clp protease, protease subunit